MKLRTIITQDAEVDDQNSLRHFLFYANEVELQGIVQTSSKYHWQGVPGAKKTIFDPESLPVEEQGPWDQPYRWPGTEWMMRVIDDYEQDYPALSRHAEGYPEPAYLRSITKVGNIGYEGEMDAPSEGSELIRKHMLDDDPRPLYLQVWGGMNTIGRALMDIQREYEDRAEWPILHERLSKKIIITACGEQDPVYRNYIAEEWPDILLVKTLQVKSYAYGWFMMPECDSKDTLRSDFMKRYILNGKSALAKGYRTWMDGTYYEGEIGSAQFGANPNIKKEWFGAMMGWEVDPQPGDFLSEGDSPTFFALFDWGFRTLEDFCCGGMSGRYCRSEERNSKGEVLNIREVAYDSFEDRGGNIQVQESMWRYVADIQRDFAARIRWCDMEKEGEHAPKLQIEEGVDLTAERQETLTLHAITDAMVRCRIYPEISASWAAGIQPEQTGNTIRLTIPSEAKIGDRLHLIVQAKGSGEFQLTHYRHVIITVE